MSQLKDGNYYTVQAFMVRDLKLKGLEKDVYAIIYGFSQAENQRYTGSLQYLADWCCSTKQGIVKSLKSLLEKGLILKESKKINNVNFVEYYTTEFNGGIKQSLTGGIQLSLPNNINKDNIVNKIIKATLKFNDNIYSTKDNNITKDNTIHSLKSLKRKYILSNKDSYVDKVSTLYTKEKIKENTNQINNNKDILKEKKKESPEVVEVFEFYQDAGLKKMRTLTDKAEKAIKKALKDYSVEELKTLIKRFKCIVKDEFYYYNYSWNVEEFFSRKEGYREFDDNGSKWQSYIAERPTIKTDQYFEPLWEMYPNKSSVREAKREFQKKFVGITDDNTALQKARYIYSRCRDYVQDTDDQYIMALSRWLESNIS